MKPQSTRLAIIGAGIAGLTAARLYQTGGLDVQLFDKGQNVGGRCATRRRDGLAFDHGAPFIAASSNDFRWTMRRWMMGAALQNWKPKAATGFPAGLRLFTGTPDMNAIPQRLATGLDITRRVTVDRIERQPDGAWRLFDTESETLGDFAAVLITCPPDQAQRLLQSGLDTGLVPDHWFRRPVRMRAAWTVMVAFDGRVPTDSDALVLDGEPLDYALRNSSKPGRIREQETWVMHAAPDITEQFLDHPKDAVVDDFLAALAYHLDAPLPRVIFAQAHRWLYAHARAEAESEGETKRNEAALPATGYGTGFGSAKATIEYSLFDPETGLGLAGDWIRPPASPYLGVQSAWLSGRDAGKRIRHWSRRRGAKA